MKITRFAALGLLALLVVGPLAPANAQTLPIVRVGKPEASALTFMALEIGQSA
jgi:hypothetical protein